MDKAGEAHIMRTTTELLELTEFVKTVTERKNRQDAARLAAARAKKAAIAREQFKPKSLAPIKPLKLKF